MSSSSSSSSYSSCVSRKKYDVFLSFRGEDTRKNFTDHLYTALKNSGIITFRDDQRLEAGEAIAPELFKAIQESWCSIIVFSETYTFSGWCLDELAEIVKERNEGTGHKIFPIFYDVDPSDLRKQTGRVAEAFSKHEERYKENRDKIESWRSALTQVADLKGWHLNNRHESEFIGDIVKKISAKLCQTYSNVPDDLIGINSRLDELHSKIDIGEDDVRIIGICGMGGIGKTTLAQVVYTQMSPHFEGKSFLSDVREIADKFGLVSLQKQLLSHIFLEECFNISNVHEGSFLIKRRLSHKKVLIVIDDVDNIQHLKWLVGRHDWFGSGSRIIITTRDEHLLRQRLYPVDDVYEPTTLDAKEALRLFNLKASNSDTPENGFIELSKRVVKYANGLPLALEVLGSRDNGAQWETAIEGLRRDSNKEIHERLQTSFDGLEETEKKIFLDIACFFKGEEKDLVMKVLDGCGFFPNIGIDVLIKKSLIKVYDKTYMREHGLLRDGEMGSTLFEQKSLFMGMHDLLQEMGRKIVKQNSPDEPGQRSRLWEERDVYHVLTNNTATEAVEGMKIDIRIKCWEEKKKFTSNADAFLKMKKLRLLKVFNLPNSHDVKYLSNELRLLHWTEYPLKALPSGFQLDNLVALLLPYSHIEQLWKGNTHLEKLKLVNLKGCKNLIKTPDFTMAPNLECLILEGCVNIVDVHPSIGHLRRLKFLNLRDCKSLRGLPTRIRMESLETLILSGCSKLLRFPEIDEEMKCLVELYLDGTGIRDLSSLFRHVSALVLLNMKDCKNLTGLPSSISGLKCLKTLNLCGCLKVQNLPESLLQVESLEELDLSETAIIEPASFISEFENLKFLSFRGCKGLPSKLHTNLPSFFKAVQRGSMYSLALRLPPLSGLTSLTQLDISYCNLCEGDIPSDICYLSSLERLYLDGNKIICLPANLDRLSNLHYLGLADCMELKSLPELFTCTSAPFNLPGLFANAVAVRNSRTWEGIRLENCYKLAENTNILTLLKNIVKESANARRESFIVLPGSEIPEWFSHRSERFSIKIPLPSNIWNDKQWIGVALCYVFVDLKSVGCTLIIHGRRIDDDPLYLGPAITKDHLFLRYWSRGKLYSLFSEDRCEEPEHLWSLEYSAADQKSIELGFETLEGVKKCGVGLVYEKDLEEIDQIKGHLPQICNSACATFEDIPFPQNADGPKTGRVASVKRKRNSYDDEAGTSSEDDSIEERPQPKRLQQILNYIMGRKH